MWGYGGEVLHHLVTGGGMVHGRGSVCVCVGGDMLTLLE